jgi:hypothetical protein
MTYTSASWGGRIYNLNNEFMETITNLQKLDINITSLKEAISEEYTNVACDKDHVMHL